MRRKRYLMAVDSVISPIKMGSSCEASCCGLLDQQYRWQQRQQGETLQGVWQKSYPTAKHVWWVWLGLCPPQKSVLGHKVVAWPPYKQAQRNPVARQDGLATVAEAARISGGFSSALTANVSSVSPAQLFIILETPWGSKLALKICLHF